MEHEINCEGGHTSDMTCAEVIAWRDAAISDKRYCPEGMYHSFGTDNLDALCKKGCGTTFREFMGLE